MNIHLLFLLTFLFHNTFIENRISGTISDSTNGELLIGAHVTLTNDATERRLSTVTGMDGRFTIRDLNVGSYTIQISYVGYIATTSKIDIETNTVLDLEFTLEPDEQILSEIVVFGDQRGSDSHARSLERRAVNVTNIVSSRQIMLSPDITVANVIQRVSGLSIERNSSGDAQYAIVRGMDKRYNNTLVNNIKIPSPDNENRFVPLDIFPAVFLERLEVSKSLTADMEADAIGGTVNMVMKNAPYEQFIDADIQVGYNHMNLETPFSSYSRSNLNRRSPSEVNGTDYRATPDDFPVENMMINEVTPMPDILASGTYGNRFFNRKLGVMAGASFQNSFKPVSNYFYDPAVNSMEGNPLIMRELIERRTSSQIQRIAVHGKVDYSLNNRNIFGLYAGKYLLNEFRVRDQVLRDNFVSDRNYAVYPVTRFTNTFQDITTFDLSGKHIPTDRFNINWNAVYSIAKNDRPDDGVFARAGQFDVNNAEVTNEIVYFQGTRNSRAWERNRDDDVSFYLNMSYDSGNLLRGSSIDFGGVIRFKERENFYNYYNYSQIFGQFRGQDWNDFNEVKFRSMANPFGSGNQSNLVYDASEEVYAGYFKTSFDFSAFEIQAGLRAELTNQGYEINSISAAANQTDLSQTQEYFHLFPSVNLKIPVNEETNIKVNYFKGISRPGFYEIVPTIRRGGGGDSFYSEQGNADLRPSIGHSADLRYEIFPRGVDQILVGIFYKRIIDPIEYGFPQVTSVDETPRTNRILPQNFDDATNFGIELDYTRYFNQFGLRMNYTYTQSNITTNKIVINQDQSFSLVNQTRPLQGQSDHIGNVSVLYKGLENGLDLQLVFNYTGERIAVVSPYLGADHIMKPMTQLDFSIERKFSAGFVIFAKANNLLNTPYQLYVKKPLALPEDPYPFQTDPTNIALVRRDLFGQSYRFGLRYNF